MPYSTFGFTEEQVLMRDSVLGLMARVLPPEKIAELDRERRFPRDAYRALAEGGWLTLPYDAAHGGMGASYKDLAVFVEALGYHHPGIRTSFMSTAVYGGLYLQNLGDESLKAELLPGLQDGSIRTAIAFTEPDSGSDAAGIRTRAVRDGDDWIISGQKVYVTNAHEADYLVVSTKTDPDAGRRRLSLFIVDTARQGFEARPMDPLGSRTTLLNEVFFDDVRIPGNRLLGEVNGGWHGLMRGLNLERVLIAAAAAGGCIKIIEVATNFVKDRRAFGKKLAEFQAVAHKFSDMRMMMETARLVTYRTAEMLDAGEEAVTETAIAKVVATENNFKVADLGMQAMGAAGYVQGDMQRLFREARLGMIGGGTSEILRNVIAGRMGI
ncbi:MAG: acyl-CoA dehydrogenase family protein [Alphaproteobacteria bacterium]|jgi:alkylation response protein AidB-like acyl-CoA dehydrogenase|nr:acyl-CoA dehydrogenase family protein [Alphaproteobacteria bacterium]